VWDVVSSLAAADGVAVRESELIGLAPLAALVDVADRTDVPGDLPVEERLTQAARVLRMRDFDPSRALELRLAAASSAVGGATGGG
jgi:hypothetical protein